MVLLRSSLTFVVVPPLRPLEPFTREVQYNSLWSWEDTASGLLFFVFFFDAIRRIRYNYKVNLITGYEGSFNAHWLTEDREAMDGDHKFWSLHPSLIVYSISISGSSRNLLLLLRVLFQIFINAGIPLRRGKVCSFIEWGNRKGRKIKWRLKRNKIDSFEGDIKFFFLFLCPWKTPRNAYLGCMWGALGMMSHRRIRIIL